MKKISGSSFFGGTVIVAGLTLVSRILGFIRDVLTAFVFGASWYADVFFVAFRIPNLLRSIVAEGALTSAFVPVIADEVKKGPVKAQEAFSGINSLLTLTTALISLAGIFFSEEIILLFAPGFAETPEKVALAAELLAIMFPLLIALGGVSLINGLLSTSGKYGASSIAQIVMNLCLIMGGTAAIFLDREEGVRVLAWSVLIGGVAQVSVQIPSIRKSGFRYSFSRTLFSTTSLQMMKLMVPAVLGASVYQLLIFSQTLMASLLEEGSVSWLFYCDRLVQLPLGIISVAMSSVLLPVLARINFNENRQAFKDQSVQALNLSFLVFLPVSVLLFIFAEPLVSLLFLRGEFQFSDAVETSRCVQASSIGLWAASMQSMMTKTYLARKRFIVPAVIGVIQLLVAVCAALLLTDFHNNENFMGVASATVREFFGISVNLKVVGIALGSSLASVAGFIILIGLKKGEYFDDSNILIKLTFSIFLACCLYLFTTVPESNLFRAIFFILGSILFYLALFLSGDKVLEKIWRRIRS